MALVAPEFELEKCLAQAKERCGTLVDTTSSLNGWTVSTTAGIPASMKIYERRDGSISPFLAKFGSFVSCGDSNRFIMFILKFSNLLDHCER